MFSRVLFATTFYVLILTDNAISQTETPIIKNQESLVNLIQDAIAYKMGGYVNYVTKSLEKYNDENFGRSAFGKLINYEEIKPKLEPATARASRTKKMTMSMALMPLMFQIGATSTWMLITTLLTAKSVLIGIALLVFKIAVSSAKVASFFTHWKDKHDVHHADLSWAPSSHGHGRSLNDIEHHKTSSSDWSSYVPEWTPDTIHRDYHTIPASEEYEELGPYKAENFRGDSRHKEVGNKKI